MVKHQEDPPMQCLLLALTDEATFLNMTNDEQQRTAAAVGEWADALRAAGVYVGSYRPQPSSTAKTVRATNGKTEVRDGLHTDTNEPLTGVYVLNVPDLDAALAWAERSPATRMGVVEVRPLVAR
jgi:hypothetical protein